METINAIGRRKAAIARIYLRKGSGNVSVNGKEVNEYFTVNHQALMAVAPLEKL